MSEDGCKMALLTQADFDGELDAARAAELAEHRATCSACQAAYAELAQVHVTLQDVDLRFSAPASLRRALSEKSATSNLAPARRTGWWQRPAVNFGFGAAMAACIALLALWSSGPNMIDQVVDDHVRALQPGHLEDVISTDRHTVKPWFEGRLDFAPPVKDLAAQEFPLTGGRLDFLNGRAIAAMIYRHGTHPINLLAWPAKDRGEVAPTIAHRNGFTTIHWTQDGMTLWAVSDLEQAQLEDFRPAVARRALAAA